MFFRFFQLREKGEWIPITDEANVSDVAQSRGAKRLTILACSEVAPHEAADKDAVQYKGPLYFDMKDVGYAHCEGVIPAGRSSCTHAGARARADEYRAKHRGKQRHFCKLRP